jgi:hypothetical protein
VDDFTAPVANMIFIVPIFLPFKNYL